MGRGDDFRREDTSGGSAQSFGDQLFVLTKSAFHDNMNTERDSPLLRVN